MQAALVVRGGSRTSSNEDGTVYRQQNPYFQAFLDLVPTSIVGAAPLVKEVLAMGASQLFLIFVGTGDFTTEVEGEKWKLPCGGQENQLTEATPLGNCCHTGDQCIYTVFFTRVLNHLR